MATTKRRFLDIRAGDTVVVKVGKDRGKRGVVERTQPGAGTIVVRGVNLHKRHTRSGAQKTRSGSTTSVIQGGIVDFEAPLNYSNVMLVCPNCDRPTRIRHIETDGRRGRVCVHCGEITEAVTSE
jgi:large subunit ribosomal protein L24